MYQKLWLTLYEKIGQKIGQKPLFSRFWDEEAFTNIFRKSIFSLVKIHHLPQKFFQNMFSSPKLSPSKLKFSSSQKSSFSSSSNFFIATFTFLDSGIVGQTENVKHVMVLLRRSVRRTHFIMTNIIISLWSEPLIDPKWKNTLHTNPKYSRRKFSQNGWIKIFGPAILESY